MRIYRIAESPTAHNRRKRREGNIQFWRSYCHELFDKLWRYNKYGISRDEAYEMLAERMGLSRVEAHFGRFNVMQCEQAAQVCKEMEKELIASRHPISPSISGRGITV